MSAGIYDKNAKINYLRYCQEYATAWIEFLPEIVKAVEKFDGKKVTARIDTAVKKVDDRFYIVIEKDRYDNKGYLYLKWFDYDGRIFTDEETGQWDYVKNTNGCDFIVMFRVQNMDCFEAWQFIESLQNIADRETKYLQSVNDALDNLDELKEEYNKTLEAFMSVTEKVPSYILDYFRVDSPYIGRWV